MPVRLITFIATLLVIVTFIGFNIENSSDIRFWFGDKGIVTNVPIFVSFFVMYLIGVVSVIPFILGWKMRRKKKDKPKINLPAEETAKASKKLRVLGGKKKESATGDENPEEPVKPSDEPESDEPVKFGKNKKKTSGTSSQT